jgi:hypothetical protein
MERTDFAELLREWKPPSGLNRARPREVRLSGAGIAIALIAVMLMAGGLVGAVFANRTRRSLTAEAESLRERGVETEAVITRLSRTGGKSESHRVSYEFTAGGETYQRTRSVPARAWRTYHVGDRLAVRYLAADPSINYPAGYEERPLPRWFPFFIVGAAILPASLLPLQILRQRRLLTDGRPAPAVITGFRRVHHTHGGYQRFVSYEFPLVGGGTAKGRGPASRNTPGEGGTICILYDPDNPKRNVPYPLQFVKLAEW